MGVRGPRLLSRVLASFVGPAMGVRGLLGEGLENFGRATLLCRGLMLLGSDWASFVGASVGFGGLLVRGLLSFCCTLG